MCFSYSVIVQFVESCHHLETEKQENTTPCRQLSWSQLGGVSRVNEQAAKVFTWSSCLVKHPCTKSTSEGKLSKIKFITVSFSVKMDELQ